MARTGVRLNFKGAVLERIEDLFGTLPFSLTKGQEIFLNRFTTSEGHFSLLGVAGSGKSTIMEILSRFYGNEIVFCASSGVANQQMPNEIGRGTAHRVMSLFRDISDPMGMKKVKKACQGLFGPSDLVKIIVVDEAFCLDSDHLHTMLKRIERFNKATRKRKQRKIRLLVVGDCLQRLP